MIFNQGDIVYLDFNPTKGHEQRGNRPALVISNADFPKYTGLHLVCPISNNTKEYPTHVRLDDGSGVTGSVFCEHLRAVDLEARNANKKGECHPDILEEVLDIVQSFI